MAKIGSIIVLLWLIVGAVAAFQRDYFSDSDTNCAEVGTIVVTVVAGPLNYFGVNPQIEDCNVPEPSQ